MEKKSVKTILKAISEFLLVCFAVLAMLELLKPNAVSAILRLDWFFGALIAFWIGYFAVSDNA